MENLSGSQIALWTCKITAGVSVHLPYLFCLIFVNSTSRTVKVTLFKASLEVNEFV